MTPSNGPLGILSAIPEELAHLDEAAGDTERVGAFAFTRGLIADRDAIFVECGAGKVNAAVAATLLLTRFGCRALLFCGVAGGLDPAYGVGDVVIATRNLQHDYGVLADGAITAWQPGVSSLSGLDRTPGYDLAPALAARLAAAIQDLRLPRLPAEVTGGTDRAPVVALATILSGDTFINCEATRRRLYATFKAAAVDMEGGAVAQACYRLDDVPFVNVRCLSDLAGATSHLDFRTFLPVAGRLAATVTRRAAAVIG